MANLVQLFYIERRDKPRHHDNDDSNNCSSKDFATLGSIK